MKIGLSVGHGAAWEGGEMVKDNGARHPEIGVTEFDSCFRIFRILCALLSTHIPTGLITAPTEVPLKQRVIHLNLEHHHRTKLDVAIELHLNAYADRDVDGVECCYWPESDRGLEAASALCDSISGAIGGRNRGPKERDDLFFLSALAPPAVIVESYFITNDKRANETLTGDLVQRAAWGIFQGLLGL